ncbi:nuclease-related domain-containing protein [Planococcus salinus]|nr:nuclease-related domain-containing protein [Planococcus salinus]
MKLARLSEMEALHALLARLPDNHFQRKFLETEIYRQAAGKRGEKRLRERFKEFDLDAAYEVLWDIRLCLGDWRVQMDGLLLTERGAIIIESKNISGKILFNEETGEFSREDLEGKKTIMEDPTVQLNKHIRFLTKWFKTQKINMPLAGIVVFTAKQSEFISKPNHTPICKTYQMPENLLKIWQAFPPEAHSTKLITIKKKLLSLQTPFRRNPLCQQYYLDPNELLAGVKCSQCQLLTMERHRKNWHCTKCGHRDSLAHHLAVQEYFSLVNTHLTNEQFRKFCRVDSPHVASRLLKQLDLKKTGELKTRSYQLWSGE